MHLLRIIFEIFSVFVSGDTLKYTGRLGFTNSGDVLHIYQDNGFNPYSGWFYEFNQDTNIFLYPSSDATSLVKGSWMYGHGCATCHMHRLKRSLVKGKVKNAQTFSGWFLLSELPYNLDLNKKFKFKIIYFPTYSRNRKKSRHFGFSEFFTVIPSSKTSPKKSYE